MILIGNYTCSRNINEKSHLCFSLALRTRGIRELKQATFLSTRTSTGSKPRRHRWRMMASAVLV